MHSPLLVILVLAFQISLAQESSNSVVFGVIKFPTPKKVLKRGTGYNKDGTKVMHSDDPMASPDRNIIISLHPLSYSVKLSPTPDAIITQKSQTFIPSVLPVTKGTTVYFLNEDEFFHNIYSLTPGSRFNIGRRPPGTPYPLKIKKSGPIKLSCDIHLHMKGIILSLETPYFTRINPDGSYHLKGIPAGKYQLRIFHPIVKEQSYEIEVKKGEKVELNVDLSN